MVIIEHGSTIMTGDATNIALDTIAFLSTINKMKKEDYAFYVMFETNLKVAFEEEPEFINEIKEFAVNMTQIFS